MSGITYGVALIILFFILPGGLFRKAYSPIHLSNYHLRASNFAEIATTLGFGMVIQCLGILIINKFHSSLYIDFRLLAKLLSSPDEVVLSKVQKHLIPIFSYNACLLLFSYVIGSLLQRLVLSLRLDERFLVLKFDNAFHYVFSGKMFLKKDTEEILTYMNVCVKIDNDFFVYSGFLLDYQLNKDGHCELIELGKVKRKVIDKHNTEFSHILKKNQHHEYNLFCDKLFIPYNQILNFGITYFRVQRVNG